MQFNLKNIVKNLLSIYDTISIEDKNISEKKIHNKKLNILRFLGNNPLFVNKLSKYGVSFSSFRQF